MIQLVSRADSLLGLQVGALLQQKRHNVGAPILRGSNECRAIILWWGGRSRSMFVAELSCTRSATSAGTR